jgi:hypothetical protein
MMYYNTVTNGAALRFGYDISNANLHGLGFGERGTVLRDAAGEPAPQVISFTPAMSFKMTLAILYELACTVLPAFLVIPVLVLGWRARYAYRWLVFAVFLLLPAAYFFYWSARTRFYAELLPFLCLALAGIVLHLWKRSRVLATALLVSLLAGQVLHSAVSLELNWRNRKDLDETFVRVVEAQRQHGKVLIFVQPENINQRSLAILSSFNVDGFPGNVVVARDLDALNVRLQREFPDHVPLRFSKARNSVTLTRLN